jgi:TetR/AcrR family transcriptional regulator, fatty acid biosynthesis regulator
VTRARMLEAAGRLLTEKGYGGLSASAVSRAAGVAQPTFYVHFRDKDDLLRAFGEAQMGALRARLRDARERVLAGQGVDAVRETFRIPLQTWLESPALLRLSMQEQHQAGSPVGAMVRQFREEVRQDLADDLVRFGLSANTAAEKEQVSLVAEAIVAQTEALALFYLEGRCKDLDAVIDVLTRFTVGVIGLSGPTPPASRN